MQEILSKIENDAKTIKKLIKDKNTKLQLIKWLKNELSYTSNAIEGNTLTRKETILVIEENLTSSSKPLKHYIEAINHARAFNYVLKLIDEGSKIDENALLNLHKIILSGLDDYNAGFYRNCPVRISGSGVIMPNYIKVPKLMNEFFNWLNNNNNNYIYTALEAHLKLVSIHPFADGNGRSARLLMNLILMKNGYMPIIVRPTDRKKYLTVIENYQLKNDIEPYLKFMLKLLERSQRLIKNMLEPKEFKGDAKLLTVSKYAKYKNLPISTVRYWVQIGKIKPKSYTDSGYMLFEKD